MSWDGKERRRFVRAAYPCRIIVKSGLKIFSSQTENISAGGVKVILEEKFKHYTSVDLELFFEKDNPIICNGRVIWVMERGQSVEKKPFMFDVGIEFISIRDSDREYINKIVEETLGKEKD